MNRRLAVLAVILVTLALAAPAFAQEHGAAPAGKNIFQYIGAAFAIGIAAAFGSLGQGRGLSAACYMRLYRKGGTALIDAHARPRKVGRPTLGALRRAMAALKAVRRG